VNALRSLRIVAWFEGTSFLLLLFVAMPLKHLFGMPLAVRIVGSVHGILFLLFTAALFRAASEHAWSSRRALWAFALGLLPFGTLLLDRALVRELTETPAASAR
jgi:integral membrane protein